MSGFLGFLRCILCCDDEEDREHETWLGSGNRNRNDLCYDNREVPNHDTFERISHPPPTTYYDSNRISQSDSQIQRENYSNSLKLPQTRITPSVQTREISIRIDSVPIPLPLPLPPKILPPSPSQSKTKTTTLGVGTSKPSEQGLSPNPNLSPFSSKSLSKPPPVSSSSSKPTKPDQTKPPVSSSLLNPTAFSSKQSPSLFRPPPAPAPSSSSSSSSSSSKPPPPPSTKPTLSLGPFNLSNDQTKSNYIQVEKGTSPLYVIPEDIKGLIEKDIVPGVLKKPLSPSTYKDYFAALLYAEDYYLEKWDGFEMKDVTLELHEAAIYRRKGKYKDLNEFDKKDDKIFVAFKVDSIPTRRPFLLSRDFASVRPSGREVEPFQGVIYRVVKSNLVLVEFGKDFHSQHYSACKYDVKFSFNRVCLKRAHQAIAAASDSLFRNFLFPACVSRNCYTASSQLLSIDHKLDVEEASAVRQILSLQGPPPYLVEGPISVISTKQDGGFIRRLSGTGMVVREAVLQIYRTFPKCRILICAPMNSTCDVLMMSLKNRDIPESDMFRANAAFRELYGVPDDILPSCLYKGECFSFHLLKELKKFKVISSTFMSSVRLHNEGIMAGHFTHIFLVDASSAIEPEAIVALANLANEGTAVVITGAPGNSPFWVRSKIARQNGLKTSCFERLSDSKLYKNLGPKVITHLENTERKSDDTYWFPDSSYSINKDRLYIPSL
uniref:Putative RNA helicase SDE3 n=1 Tax=Davidia involucrata TaxID=16924 RepID=A0A5B7B2P6_DAVIN